MAKATARHDGPILQMQGVERSYGEGPTKKVALHDLDFSVKAGSMVAVMGHSGSGKSTLLNLAGGLDRPSAGEIRLLDIILSDLDGEELVRARRQTVAYVFQDYNLVRPLTARENVMLPLELGGVNRRRAIARAEEALASVGLGGQGAKFPDQMSGGEQQRVALARALVDGRPILLADEPTGALDSKTSAVVVGLLRAAVQNGTTCVLATHNPEVAAAADRIVTMRDGVVESDSRANEDAATVQ